MKTYKCIRLRRDKFREAFDRRDKDLINDMIRFLIDDPFDFRMGYNKQRMWRYIKQVDLSTDQVKRLEHASLKYIERLPSRPFREMCVTMSRIGMENFWQSVQKRIHST